LGAAGHPAGAGNSVPLGLAGLEPAEYGDRNFARAAAAGGLSEVELGQLADQKGLSSELRSFGQRMGDDHSKANDQLKELAAVANIPLPNAPRPEDQAMWERLDKMQRDAFELDPIRGTKGH
jgi:putative membrane protein